jgi:hypothetical protein
MEKVSLHKIMVTDGRKTASLLVYDHPDRIM